MMSVCLYMQVHQPYRVRRYRIFDLGQDDYFADNSESDLNNARVMRKVALKSYLPTCRVLQEIIDDNPEFKLTLSFSGTVLEQMEDYAPEVLEAFQKLIGSGQVEVLAETYYHSLAFFYDQEEFADQVKLHRKKVYKLFGAKPKVLRNTELAYTNSLGHWAAEEGYQAVLAEGWDYVLGWRSPNYLYHPPENQKTKLLLKNYRLSDDIAFRFSEESWAGWPLDTETFASWIHSHHGSGDTINLFMDFETFGEHQWEDSGIFNFLRHLPAALQTHPDTYFHTASEVAQAYPVRGAVDVPHVMTWADTERDLSAWTGNRMQQHAISLIYELGKEVRKRSNDELLEKWRRLQTSDHFYYMCTKWSADGDVHAYFSPYESPYEAYIAYMNVLRDLASRVNKSLEDYQLTQ